MPEGPVEGSSAVPGYDVEAVRETVPHLAKVVARRDITIDLWNGSRKVTGSVLGVELHPSGLGGRFHG